MPKVRSWWRRKKVYHRDAVILATLASACLLAGELANQDIAGVYLRFILPVLSDPALLFWNILLSVLAFMNYFGGILVLLGGIDFLWGRASRGRFFVGLGTGLSSLILLRLLAYATLTKGQPFIIFTGYAASLSGIGLLLGFASYLVMHEYSIMLKKHARSKWRQWRQARRPRPVRRRTRGSANAR
jgi:hypothetical protein